MKIIFESHKTTEDNEGDIVSGWSDVEISQKGWEQAQEMKEKYQEIRDIDAIFCSDLQRSYDTGLFVFRDHGLPIIMDSRLRECNYGVLNGAAKETVFGDQINRITTPYEGGESYTDCVNRISDFLNELKEEEYKKIVIVGHKATQYGIEHIILGKDIETLVTEKWQWQPGWQYTL